MRRILALFILILFNFCDPELAGNDYSMEQLSRIWDGNYILKDSRKIDVFNFKLNLNIDGTCSYSLTDTVFRSDKWWIDNSGRLSKLYFYGNGFPNPLYELDPNLFWDSGQPFYSEGTILSLKDNLLGLNFKDSSGGFTFYLSSGGVLVKGN